MNTSDIFQKAEDQVEGVPSPEHGALRVIAVMPSESEGATMIFAKRQMNAVAAQGVLVRPFYLPSRTSPVSLLSRWLALREEVRAFCPSVIHAHYGSITSFFCAL